MFHLDSSLINFICADKAFPVAIFQNTKTFLLPQLSCFVQVHPYLMNICNDLCWNIFIQLYNKSSKEREDRFFPNFYNLYQEKNFSAPDGDSLLCCPLLNGVIMKVLTLLLFSFFKHVPSPRLGESFVLFCFENLYKVKSENILGPKSCTKLLEKQTCQTCWARIW